MPKDKTKISLNFVFLSLIRIFLIVLVYASISSNRRLILFSVSTIFILSFLPYLYKKLFKKDCLSLVNTIILLSVFVFFSFWEIKGAHWKGIFFPVLMNILEALVIGLLGFTLVYSFFSYHKISENYLIISLLAFSLSFSIGTILELSEILLDKLFNFNIHASGVYGVQGDLAIYLFGSILVSFFGYYSLKNGKTVFISKLIGNLIEKNKKRFRTKDNSDNSQEEIINLIKKGESDKLEFKSSLRKNLHTQAFDKQIEHAVLKTINAYLNSNDGTLLIGVSDKGEIVGIEHDQFESEDSARRYLLQRFKDFIGIEFSEFIKADIIKIGDKKVMRIDCKKSNKETFVKSGNDEIFYVRHGSLSTPLSGSSLLKYIENNFRNKR
jgi:hypothetical protein